MVCNFDEGISQQITAVQSRVAALHTRWEGMAAAKNAEAQAEWAKGTLQLGNGSKGLHCASAETQRSFTETIAAEHGSIRMSNGAGRAPVQGA
jgi:uncharacterized protein YukE